jgi:hypothetical protein
MTTPEEKEHEEALAESRRLQTLVQSQASADTMMLVLSVAALMPVVQSIMAFSSAGSRQNHQAVSESAHSAQTGNAVTARAINTMFDSPRDAAVAAVSREVQHPYYPPYPYVT